MSKHVKWLHVHVGLRFFWVSVGVKYIIISVIYLYNKNMGTCNNSSVAQLVESRTQKPKCMGSNHGVDNRLVDLARKNISNRIAEHCVM